MRKFRKKKPEAIEILDLEEIEEAQAEQELEERKAEIEEQTEKIDVNSIEVVVDRVTHGLIGSLRIEDNINKPIIKVGDIVHLKIPSRFLIKDFVLYKVEDSYFLRRIIKYKDDGIYVAGDNEKQYHVIQKEDIIGKVIGRERKNKFKSFSLTPGSKIYTFRKVKLSYFRLGNRVLDYQTEINYESLELAKQSAQQENQTAFTNITKIDRDIDLDSDLASFLNPDDLVKELRDAQKGVNNDDESEEEYYEEVVEEIVEVEEAVEEEDLELEEEIIEEAADDENSEENMVASE